MGHAHKDNTDVMVVVGREGERVQDQGRAGKAFHVQVNDDKEGEVTDGPQDEDQDHSLLVRRHEVPQYVVLVEFVLTPDDGIREGHADFTAEEKSAKEDNASPDDIEDMVAVWPEVPKNQKGGEAVPTPEDAEAGDSRILIN